MYEIKNDIKKIKTEWTCYAHVGRMNIKKMLLKIPRGKKPRGRPRTRWLHQIREDIEDIGQTWTDKHTTRTWEDRDDWRSLCNSQSK